MGNCNFNKSGGVMPHIIGSCSLLTPTNVPPTPPKTIRGDRSLTKRKPTTTARNGPGPGWEALSQTGAVLIRTPEFGPVWLAIDQATADEIRAEERQSEKPCPVLTADDVAHLEIHSDIPHRGAIEVVRMFPGARITH